MGVRRDGEAAQEQTMMQKSPRKRRRHVAPECRQKQSLACGKGLSSLLCILCVPEVIGSHLRMCLSSLVSSDLDSDFIVARNSEYVAFLNELLGQENEFASFASLPKLLQQNYDDIADDDGAIHFPGKMTDSDVSPDQHESLSRVCTLTQRALSEVSTSPSRSQNPNIFARITTQFIQCRASLAITDLDRDERISQTEYLGFVNRLSDDRYRGFEFDDLTVLLQINFNSVAVDGLIDVTGSRPGSQATDDQMIFLENFCIQTESALTQAAGLPVMTPLFPSPQPSQAPSSQPPTRTPAPTVYVSIPPTIPYFRCRSSLAIADLNRNSALSQTEYVGLINHLTQDNFIGLSFIELPDALQLAFEELVTDGFQIDIFGASPFEAASSDQVMILENVCRVVDKAIDLVGGYEKVPTVAPVPSSNPTSTPIMPTAPTVSFLMCRLSMAVSDVSRDDELDEEEYTSFVNRIAERDYSTSFGKTFRSLPPSVRQNFFNLVEDGVIPIYGTKPGQAASFLQVDYLTSVCTATSRAIAGAISFVTPAPTIAQRATSAPVVAPVAPPANVPVATSRPTLKPTRAPTEPPPDEDGFSSLSRIFFVFAIIALICGLPVILGVLYGIFLVCKDALFGLWEKLTAFCSFDVCCPCLKFGSGGQFKDSFDDGKKNTEVDGSERRDEEMGFPDFSAPSGPTRDEEKDTENGVFDTGASEGFDDFGQTAPAQDGKATGGGERSEKFEFGGPDVSMDFTLGLESVEQDSEDEASDDYDESGEYDEDDEEVTSDTVNESTSSDLPEEEVEKKSSDETDEGFFPQNAGQTNTPAGWTQGGDGFFGDTGGGWGEAGQTTQVEATEHYEEDGNFNDYFSKEDSFGRENESKGNSTNPSYTSGEYESQDDEEGSDPSQGSDYDEGFPDDKASYFSGDRHSQSLSHGSSQGSNLGDSRSKKSHGSSLDSRSKSTKNAYSVSVDSKSGRTEENGRFGDLERPDGFGDANRFASGPDSFFDEAWGAKQGDAGGGDNTGLEEWGDRNENANIKSWGGDDDGFGTLAEKSADSALSEGSPSQGSYTSGEDSTYHEEDEGSQGDDFSFQSPQDGSDHQDSLGDKEEGSQGYSLGDEEDGSQGYSLGDEGEGSQGSAYSEGSSSRGSQESERSDNEGVSVASEKLDQQIAANNWDGIVETARDLENEATKEDSFSDEEDGGSAPDVVEDEDEEEYDDENGSVEDLEIDQDDNDDQYSDDQYSNGDEQYSNDDEEFSHEDEQHSNDGENRSGADDVYSDEGEQYPDEEHGGFDDQHEGDHSSAEEDGSLDEEPRVEGDDFDGPEVNDEQDVNRSGGGDNNLSLFEANPENMQDDTPEDQNDENQGIDIDEGGSEEEDGGSEEEDGSEDDDEGESDDDDESSGETSSQERRRDEYRRQVEDLVRRYIPDEFESIDSMMEEFRGREPRLLATLQGMEERSNLQRARNAIHKSKMKPSRRISSGYPIASEGSAIIAAASTVGPRAQLSKDDVVGQSDADNTERDEMNEQQQTEDDGSQGMEDDSYRSEEDDSYRSEEDDRYRSPSDEERSQGLDDDTYESPSDEDRSNGSYGEDLTTGSREADDDGQGSSYSQGSYQSRGSYGEYNNAERSDDDNGSRGSYQSGGSLNEGESRSLNEDESEGSYYDDDGEGSYYDNEGSYNDGSFNEDDGSSYDD